MLVSGGKKREKRNVSALKQSLGPTMAHLGIRLVIRYTCSWMITLLQVFLHLILKVGAQFEGVGSRNKYDVATMITVSGRRQSKITILFTPIDISTQNWLHVPILAYIKKNRSHPNS